MKKLPSSSEVANILVGHVTFLSEPIIVFLRLEKAVQFEDMSEIAAPTRFLFVYLGPPPASATIKEYEEIGRAAATLLTDKVTERSLVSKLLSLSSLLLSLPRTK
jgi:hypothetical protein